MVCWCFPPKLCVFLFLSLSILFSIPLSFSYSLSIHISLSTTSLFCLMQTLIYILKGHMRPLLCCVIFNDFQIFDQITTLTYFNLNLCSYGQLFFVIVYLSFCILIGCQIYSGTISSSLTVHTNWSIVEAPKGWSIYIFV